MLVYQYPLSDQARERLKVLTETNDGFVIAEKDLELRGFGDLSGTRQSGLPALRLGDLRRDHALMVEAREAAERWLAETPDALTTRRPPPHLGRALRSRRGRLVPLRAPAPRQGLRIVAGALKGRRLTSPTWTGLRPTSDRLRETLFNVLGQTCQGASVLDAFAGTGAVGIEALSRGAAHVMFVDHDPRALALIRQNLERCGVTDRYTIQRMDLARSGLAAFPTAFDLIFLDPPYETNPTDACAALASVAGRRRPAGGGARAADECAGRDRRAAADPPP